MNRHPLEWKRNMNVKSSNQKHHMKYGAFLKLLGIEWLSNEKKKSNQGDNKSKQFNWQITFKGVA